MKKEILLYKFGFLILLIFPLALSAQQTKRSSGKSHIRIEDNMTKEEARKKAEELAKIDAIINAFGQFVEQEANIHLSDGRSNFNIVGNTKVKGEWIRELSKTFNEESRDEKGTFGMVKTQWITCMIKGIVKEATPKANIEFNTLNYPNSKAKTTTFYSNEHFYLWFRSPVDGYLSVFLNDGDKFYRLLPYDDMSNKNAIKVFADKTYIFFSPKKEHNYFNNRIDELILYTPYKNELNTLHIIFSEKEYFKPVLSSGYEDIYGHIIPKSLSKSEFQNWLSNNKFSINDFIDAQISIEIFQNK